MGLWGRGGIVGNDGLINRAPTSWYYLASRALGDGRTRLGNTALSRRGSFNLLNFSKDEEEAEYANEENSTGDKEVYAKAIAISNNTCDDGSYNASQIAQEVHDAPNRADRSFRRDQ